MVDTSDDVDEGKHNTDEGPTNDADEGQTKYHPKVQPFGRRTDVLVKDFIGAFSEQERGPALENLLNKQGVREHVHTVMDVRGVLGNVVTLIRADQDLNAHASNALDILSHVLHNPSVGPSAARVAKIFGITAKKLLARPVAALLTPPEKRNTRTHTHTHTHKIRTYTRPLPPLPPHMHTHKLKHTFVHPQANHLELRTNIDLMSCIGS
jgi:hypothetical protein